MKPGKEESFSGIVEISAFSSALSWVPGFLIQKF
jgi:hypothetical protein